MKKKLLLKTTVLPLLLWALFNSTTSQCMETLLAPLNNSYFATIIKENKSAALLAGATTLSVGVLGLTTYNLWKSNNALKRTVSKKKREIESQEYIISCANNNCIEALVAVKQLQNDLAVKSFITEKLERDIRILTEENSLYKGFLQKEKKCNLNLQECISRFTQMPQGMEFFPSLQKFPKVRVMNGTPRKKKKNIVFEGHLNTEHKVRELEEDFILVRKENSSETIQDFNARIEKEKEKDPVQYQSMDQPLTQSLIIEDEQPLLFKTENCQKYSFDPILITNNKHITDKTIILVTIHGTFVDSNEFGRNAQEAISQDIIDFAKKLARDQKCNVRIIPFCWSGALNAGSRKEAGEVLAEHLKKNCNDDQELWAITHSHGGNVLLWASEFMKGWRPIDCGINIAPPIADIHDLKPVNPRARLVKNDNKALNIKNHFNFYSTGDVTQGEGSNHSTATVPLLSGNFERRINFLFDNKRKLWNIRIQDDGKEPSHLSIIQPVIKNLHELLPLIKLRYARVHDLDANIAQYRDLPHVVIRNLVRSQGKKPETDKEKIYASQLYSDRDAEDFENHYGRTIDKKTMYTAIKVLYEAGDALGALSNKFWSWVNSSNN